MPWQVAAGVSIWSLFFVLIIASIVLKAMAMWRAARREEKGWFVALLIFNTAGILPLLYLLIFGKETKKKK